MFFAQARDQARSPMVVMRQLAGTSPGKMFIVTLILAIGAILVGLYASNTLDARTSALSQTVSDTEPTAESTQILYSNLSIADASANAAFISGGLEPAALRVRYANAIATASKSLIQAASGSTEATNPVRSELDLLAQQLPVYTGLVETARTNNRVGNPVGSAYLGEASTLMQNSILPAAQRLYTQRSGALSDPQNKFTNPPWAVYVWLAVLVIALAGAHQLLARRTRRTLNLGLLLAMAASVIAVIWVLGASLLSVSSVNTAETRGAQPLQELTSARILTQQARSMETLSLARRSDQAALQRQFTDSFRQIQQTVERYGDHAQGDAERTSVERARAALTAWRVAHATALRASSTGDITNAMTMVVGDSPDGTSRAYTALDDALVDGIAHTRNVFRNNINTARAVVGSAGTAALSLCLFAAATTALGMTPRIREYR